MELIVILGRRLHKRFRSYVGYGRSARSRFKRPSVHLCIPAPLLKPIRIRCWKVCRSRINSR